MPQTEEQRQGIEDQRQKTLTRWHELETIRTGSEDALTRLVATVSAGVLGLSAVFIGRSGDAESTELLLASWSSFGLALILVLIRYAARYFFDAARANMTFDQAFFDVATRRGERNRIRLKFLGISPLASWRLGLGSAFGSVIFLIVGLVLLVVFAAMNL